MKTQTSGCKTVLAIAGMALLSSGTGFAFTHLNTAAPITAAATLTGAGTVTMSLALKKVVGGAASTQIGWGAITLPARWVVADDYIELTATVTGVGGGIQTYTDNKASDANPAFSGNVNAITPAGLIDTADTTKKLPTAWSVRDNTTASALSADPGANAGDSFLWFFHLDKSQVAIGATISNFNNGDPFMTVQSADGIHFAQGPAQFGTPSTAPVSKIFVEADFGAATTSAAGHTYKTNKLILESFTQ